MCSFVGVPLALQLILRQAQKLFTKFLLSLTTFETYDAKH